MQYNRKNISPLTTFTPFEEGVHQAKIVKVEAKKSNKQNDLFEFHLEGANREQGKFYLTFGSAWTDANLQRILASIEDNNQTIASIDYGYNQETLGFLTNKYVFIKVVKRTGTYMDKNGIEQPEKGTKVANFLTKEEYNKLGGNVQQYSSDMDSLDDDLPF
ncbi:hypothetical protein P0E63_08940 [Enterococcus faecalis]|uniref:hypothetical protein n=1 Tax=Enterococcus TaxID=1350 RepID=UPI00035487BE|nr:hypothetical protein [Enterococcus faecalis]EPH81487.1 hypothetical protein D924_02607 [Enterococcus faecalis 06-MB-S-10]EPH87661.1 hypothetical protein D923_02437 [Enterococcus faecalis 06-MB-S-04]EPH88410.1 hypothetical protein D921_02904 [Enterococcus faecalis F01966]MCU2242694.1 hypothetical protein [Enterococcus faecalis]MDN3127983.1 hypothetical protein [Enterococcus faecalis]